MRKPKIRKEDEILAQKYSKFAEKVVLLEIAKYLVKRGYDPKQIRAFAEKELERVEESYPNA